MTERVHIQIPVTLDAANRRKDRSVSLRLSSTAELSTYEYANIDRHLLESGWLTFSPSALQAEDLPTSDPDGFQQKSKGQRMRAIHYLLYKKTGSDLSFERWYDARFEAMMSRWKEYLD